MSSDKEEKETYLGDGLYVSFDEYQFRLRAPRSDGDDIVYLEPEVCKSLVDYILQTAHSSDVPGIYHELFPQTFNEG